MVRTPAEVIQGSKQREHTRAKRIGGRLQLSDPLALLGWINDERCLQMDTATFSDGTKIARRCPSARERT
jgi:HD superfamily phosphodiesterase